MPQKPPAKKAWQTRNTSGLRNQQIDLSVVSEKSGHPTPAGSLAPSPEGDESDLEKGEDLDFLRTSKTGTVVLAGSVLVRSLVLLDWTLMH